MQTALTFISNVFAGVQEAGLDVHNIPFASRTADVLGYEVSPANSYFSGTGKRKSRIRSVARTVSSRRRISRRAMELASGHESFLALSNCGALSILDASFKFARAFFLVSGEPCSTVRLEQRAFGRILCVLHSERRLRAGFGGGPRLGTDKVQEQFQVHPCHATCAPLHRAGCFFLSVQVRTRMRCRLPEGSGLSGSVLQLLDPSEW